jgi:transcriptional regulator with XRE-family HTH domain
MKMDIKDRLLELLNEKGWTINKLAYEAGLTASTVYSIVINGNSPTIQTLEILCETLGIGIGDFFNDTFDLSSEENTLLSNYNTLSEGNKKIVQNISLHISEWK